MKVLFWVFLAFLINSCERPGHPDYTGQKGKINDADSNVYKTIGIGYQIWMAENLRTTKFNDNKIIPNIKDSLTWINLTSAGYCFYNNDSLLKIPYGALYNWSAVSSEKLCPIGWHVPSADEWTIMINNLGGSDVAGGKLKVIGTDYWISPNKGATNTSMFNAIPGGGNFHGGFLDFGKWCHFWSITQIDERPIFTTELYYKSTFALIGPGGIDLSGLSVRCIKNEKTK